jgi:imidazolonepropionase-like amidohydrolase
MPLLISGGTLLDGVADRAVRDQAILVADGRIVRMGPRESLAAPDGAKVIDAAGKFIIPGLMDGNVHLLVDFRLENLVRYEFRYEELIAEAAQIALKSGLTTVFDTWGPRAPLVSVRDKIGRGLIPGSRIFCGGNIIGFDGPFSDDFLPEALKVASRVLVDRINSIWAENVGPELSWMTPKQVAAEIRSYIQRGVNFLKFASSDHRVPAGPSTFLALSPRVQRVIVEEAHAAGLTAQSHAQSVEALWASVEAGCNIIQHCNISGPTPIPDETIDLMCRNKCAGTVFPMTRKRYQRILDTHDVLIGRLFTEVSVKTNVKRLIESDVRVLLGTDQGVNAADQKSDPLWIGVVGGEDNLFEMGQGHFVWFKAMEEMGMPPMGMLKAATANIAAAYGKADELGTIEVGKIADMLILDKDPLQSAENYRSISLIIKDGEIVDRDRLPLTPILSKSVEPFNVPDTYSKRIRRGGFPGLCNC